MNHVIPMTYLTRAIPMRRISVTCQGNWAKKPKDLVGPARGIWRMPWRPRHPVGWRCRVSRGARKTMLGTASAAWDAGPAPDRTPARPATQSSRHHTDASPMTTGHRRQIVKRPANRRRDRAAHRALDRLSTEPRPAAQHPEGRHGRYPKHRPYGRQPSAHLVPPGANRGWLRADSKGYSL